MQASTRAPRTSFALFALAIAIASPDLLAGPWEVGGTGIDRGWKAKLEYASKRADGERSDARPVFGVAGPWNERLSWEVALGYGTVTRDGGMRDDGFRDFDAKLKWKPFDGPRAGLDWLVEPKLSLPTGDTDIGAGRTRLELPLRAGRAFGATYLTAEVRYLAVAGGDDLVGAGGLVEYAPDPRWLVGLDLFADAPRDDTGAWHLRTNAGIKWRPGKRFELQGLVGRTLRNQRGAPATSLKLVAELKF